VISARVCEYCFYQGTWIIRGKPHDRCSITNDPIQDVSQATCERYKQSYPAQQMERWHKEAQAAKEKQTRQLPLFEVIP